MSRSEEEQPPTVTLVKDGLLDIPNRHNKVLVHISMYTV